MDTFMQLRFQMTVQAPRLTKASFFSLYQHTFNIQAEGILGRKGKEFINKSRSTASRHALKYKK